MQKEEHESAPMGTRNEGWEQWRDDDVMHLSIPALPVV
jgi:hypothetical protein